MTEILLEQQGVLGRITLNRPKALNSLTLGMVRTMTETLLRWRDDDRIQVVLVEGAGERGLCAGGDIRALYDAAKAGDDSFGASFWAEEYRLNAMLAHYPKPVVSVMDGICMGGGIGIAAHDSHRVVTERSKVGMPEVGIGFVPDVGGTYLLSHAPGELGTHLALTGDSVGALDAIHCGLADYYVPSDRLGKLADALAGGAVDEALRAVSEPSSQAPSMAFRGALPPEPRGTTGTSVLQRQRDWIDATYSASTVEEILTRLRSRAEENAGARYAVESIEAKSPTSLKVTLRSLRAARAFSTLEQALDQEFRVSMACLRWGDFIEGIRATVVDKDRDPQWTPGRLEDVGAERVERFLAPLGDEDLGLA